MIIYWWFLKVSLDRAMKLPDDVVDNLVQKIERHIGPNYFAEFISRNRIIESQIYINPRGCIYLSPFIVHREVEDQMHLFYPLLKERVNVQFLFSAYDPIPDYLPVFLEQGQNLVHWLALRLLE